MNFRRIESTNHLYDSTVVNNCNNVLCGRRFGTDNFKLGGSSIAVNWLWRLAELTRQEAENVVISWSSPLQGIWRRPWKSIKHCFNPFNSRQFPLFCVFFSGISSFSCDTFSKLGSAFYIFVIIQVCSLGSFFWRGHIIVECWSFWRRAEAASVDDTEECSRRGVLPAGPVDSSFKCSRPIILHIFQIYHLMCLIMIKFNILYQ